MDVISNFLIAIKNAGNAGKEFTELPYSAFKHSIAKALLDTGYITSFEKKNRDNTGHRIIIGIKYTSDNSPRITQIKRVSKSSRRLYAGVKGLYEVKHGRGHLFVSTPKGIFTAAQAKAQQVGGELLFEIW
jgi:small subunit ribosomal protein S8